MCGPLWCAYTVITMNRGVQFTSAMWSSWCEPYGEQHTTTTTFHPQANGIVELHRRMKDTLHARGGATTWVDDLPWVMPGIRESHKEESGTSSGEAALGHVLAVPGQPLPVSGCLRARRCRRRSSQRPRGLTLKQQPHQPWRGPHTSACSEGVW